MQISLVQFDEAIDGHPTKVLSERAAAGMWWMGAMTPFTNVMPPGIFQITRFFAMVLMLCTASGSKPFALRVWGA